MQIERDEAIRLLAARDLGRLTLHERADQLGIMSLDGWDRHPAWEELPAELRRELEAGGRIADPGDPRYDVLLRPLLAEGYWGASNAYLLAELGGDHDEVLGEPPGLAACPCCGLCTLRERASFEICPVCWWEDDGQDDADAPRALGGPNGPLSLTRARINVLRAGIYDLARDDLRMLQEPRAKYPVGRRFALGEGDEVRDLDSGWVGRLADEVSLG
ncbi:MAG: CPCC family cysteine-rich protein [Planctomycetota bacterium]